MTTDIKATDTTTNTNWREDLEATLTEVDTRNAAEEAELNILEATRQIEKSTRLNTEFLEYLKTLGVDTSSAQVDNKSEAIIMSNYKFYAFDFDERNEQHLLRSYCIDPITDDEMLQENTGQRIATGKMKPAGRQETPEESIIRQKLLLATALRNIDQRLPVEKARLEMIGQVANVFKMIKRITCSDNPLADNIYSDDVLTIENMSDYIIITVGFNLVFRYENYHKAPVRVYRPGNWEEYLKALYDRLVEQHKANADQHKANADQQLKDTFVPFNIPIEDMGIAVEKALVTINQSPSTEEEDHLTPEEAIVQSIKALIHSIQNEYYS